MPSILVRDPNSPAGQDIMIRIDGLQGHTRKELTTNPNNPDGQPVNLVLAGGGHVLLNSGDTVNLRNGSVKKAKDVETGDRVFFTLSRSTDSRGFPVNVRVYCEVLTNSLKESNDQSCES